MTKKQLRHFVWLFLAMLGMAQSAVAADFKDFSVILNNQEGTLLTAGEQEQGTTVNFGVAVAADGTVSRVEAGDASAVATVSGKYHSDHGCTNLQVVVPVTGNVKITVGQCTYSTSEIKVTNSAGAVVVSKTPNGPDCWKNGHTAVDELYYAGEATTLTISGMSYCPYIAVEATDFVPTKYAISYSLGNETAEGVVPAGAEVTGGETYTIAKNFTLYKEGYTLTGWTDGSKTYETGETITPESDLALTPVFTANTVSLADRTDATEVSFVFRRDQGAPTVGYEGVTGIWVTQAVVKGQTIDVKADFSTSPGKFANANWTDWAQMNNGTTWTIPSCKGAIVSIEAYNELTTTSIDGQTDYTSGKTISYTVANSAETIDVVIGSDGSYYRYIKTVLPVVEGGNVGEVFNNVNGSVKWTVGNEENGTPDDAIKGALSNSTVSVGEGLTVELKTYFDQTMTQYTPKNSDAGVTPEVMIEYLVKTKAGVTFKPTNVSFDAVKVGTDGAFFKYSYTTDGTESTVTDVPAATILRNNNANAATAQLTHSIDITADAANEFTFRFYISNTANNKNIALSNIVITGIANGTVEAVPEYTLTAVASPAEGGSVTIYPNGGVYEEGSTIRLTATKNFGYKFVNWTNKAGQEVSTEPVYTFDITADEEMTANFQKLNTYELNLTVDGTNDYMVKIAPAPTMVDGKMMYEDGTAVQLTADQYEGLVTFTNWSDGETNSGKTISMTADVELTAFYTENDIVAGWDFYKSGGGGRKADFASEENEAVTLSLVNTENPNDVQGWLDKSTEAAGGYESFAGAAVNWRVGNAEGDVGNYHWQTKLNAEAFTDMNVQFDMLYNYNAYQTYNAEYSLDGETWTKFGSINMTGAKTPASFSEKLPEAANNQAALYIRLIADKSSKVDGTSSKNDGNALAMFFITGTPKLIDDGTAPALVSTVPAEGATGASATGKIVLTFDERVKLTDNAKATLGDLTLTPAVSGKTVTFEYKGLEYSTAYTFTLAPYSVSDLTDNTLAEEITINFTTMVRPSVTKALYDFIVPDDGTFKEALEAAAKRADTSKRYRIFVKKGNYVIPANKNVMVTGTDGKQYPDPKTSFGSPNVSIIGEDAATTSITNELPNSLADNPDAGKGGQANPLEGIRTSGVLYLTNGAQNTYFQDIKLWSATADNTGRNVVLVDGGNRTVCKNVTLWAYQDTYVSDSERSHYYFEGGLLRGRTDFICGSGDVFFNGSTLQMCEDGGYISVPRSNVKYGYVYKDCTIKGETSKVDGNYYLGRPWTEAAESYYINTVMEALPRAEGWANMSAGGCTRFAEYNSVTANGTPVDLSNRAKELGNETKNPNNPVLTAEEALEIGNLHNMFGDWDPTLLTEQAPTPKNVVLDGTTLKWDDSQYALLWAVCKNGEVIDFTIQPSYIVDDTNAEYSVRAANEMGGLSEAVKVGEGSGIQHVNADTNADETIYDLQGRRVEKAAKGVYIINGRKVIVK